MLIAAGEPLRIDMLGQPRAEPEIALVFGRDVPGVDARPADVLRAVESVHPAIEILDSRYAGYKFSLPDVIADNASGGRFVLGPPTSPADIPDLDLIGCVFSSDGAVRSTASGAATMGHPAIATAWLVRALATHGRGLRAGDIVLTGGLTAVVELSAGMAVTAVFDRIGAVTVDCVSG
jgi:2-keto-4-pentenoate hydratase